MQLRKRRRERRHAHFFRLRCKIDDLCSGESSWYIRGLIEHKIIRARRGRFYSAAKRRAFQSLFFSDLSSRDWTETREQLPGPCYPNPKILLLAIVLRARALDYSFLRRQTSSLVREDDTARRFPLSFSPPPIPIISRQRFAGTAHLARSYRNSVTSVSPRKSSLRTLWTPRAPLVPIVDERR